MYTIKQAAARTGLSVPIIRVWERRYGVVTPSRTPAGYRLYDDESIARLVAMRHLVADEGWRPSQASQRVLEPGVDLAALGGGGRAGADRHPSRRARQIGPDPRTARSPARRQRDRETSLVDAFLAAARELDVPAMERILDESFASQRFELGRSRGSWRRPCERSAAPGPGTRSMSAPNTRRARRSDVGWRASSMQPVSATGMPRVIVGLPPDGHHEIGAFAFAVAARRAGLDVLYLGANVPLESWLRTVRETAAPIVVLGVVTASDVAAAGAVLDALSASERPPICLVGGPLTSASLDGLGTIRLPARLDDAVATVVGLLRSGPAAG